MRFTVETSVFMEAINIASRAVASKSPMSVLEGLLIEADSCVKITGHDLKKSIYTKIDANIYEQGKCVVNTKLLSEMIRRFPDGIVEFYKDEKTNSITVNCGKSHFSIMGLEVSEYPEIPTFSELNNITVAQGLLKEMIARTLFAVSKDESRPVYTGSLFEIEDTTITIVSIDGYRMAIRSADIKNINKENCTFIVPGFALTDIEKICGDNEDPVQITVGEKHIKFNIDNTELITRRIEGEFLNYRKSIPSTYRYELIVDKKEFASTIERVSLMLTEGNSTPIKMTFNENIIECQSITPVGKAEDACPCQGFAEGLVIGFNNRYFIEALKNAEGDELKLCINTTTAPCIIKCAQNEDLYTYMILPVRLRQ